MAPWTVTEKAAAQMKALADGLQAAKEALGRETRKLCTCFQEQRNGLGCHAGSIGALLEEIEAAEQAASAPLTKLALKLQRAAAVREAILTGSPYGSGGPQKSGGSREAGAYVSIGGVRHMTDDNGTPYARRNSETGQYECLPDTSYQLNGYTYETDGAGNVARVSGTLRRKEEGKRKTIHDTVPGMLPGDERSHLIGDRFAGSNRRGNLVAMGFDVNRSDYRALEDIWAWSLEEGRRVDVDIQPIYEEGSRRPSVFVVAWEIDGDPDITLFENI